MKNDICRVTLDVKISPDFCNISQAEFYCKEKGCQVMALVAFDKVS